ncbi:dynamin family protein [Paenibacillus illinoisensis]|uniref:dynamin family protein n=1 Tax=Paenibacillus illinoisensis TaxID=59845 RepID=UPI00203C20F0|nr:dynamin family protein [Paenibacillus illinoisensis]MCM3207795.1 dynamin family protein [Paenibacillus illinoisensis]
MTRTDYPVELAEPLLSLRKAMEQTEDHTAVQALTDLMSKAEMKQLTIAFCGHFSAGKSSLINSLCGKRVLPSSPVPTSANVVSIRNGAPRALIYTAANESADNQEVLADPLEVSPEQLEEYCKNGGAYRSIEVWDDIPLLADDAVLLDTPGVDSTDRGHGLATHSALHLADVVFYVMDYNHVQSESNLSFAKSLSDWGKPLFLIVNQIDKHRERELAFDEYVKGVEAIFDAWEVRYDGLLFTSLRDKDHRYNQWHVLPDLIKHMLNEKEALIRHSLASSASHITEQHLIRQAEQREDEEAALLEEIGGQEGIERLERELDKLKAEEDELRAKPSREREKFRGELESLLLNANLTPADIRTSAAAYLESRKPGFRVGLLFSGGKTEQEKQRRAVELVKMLQDQTSGQVEVHIRTMLRKLGEAHQLWSPDWEQAMNTELPVLDEALLEMKRSAGAEVSPEYVLQFSKEVRGEIEARYRRSAMMLADRMLEALGAQGEAALQALDASRAAVLAQSAAAARYTAMQRNAAAEAAGLRSLLPPAGPLPSGLLQEVQGPHVPAQEPSEAHGSDPGTSASVAAQPQTEAPPRKAAAHRQPAAGAQRRRRLDAAAARLEAAAALVEPYPAMGSAVRDLRARAASLAGGTFTLALFGAFSAGKSSFANALLGEAVLPVSPHPTTAAINRIMAPAGGAEHGTARVRMKTLAAFQEDLTYSFRLLGLGEPVADWQKRVQSLSPQDVHPAGRPHYSFLQAAAAGWDDTMDQLGQDVQVDLNGYRNFVANERKSCFVDSIDLYYSCDVTEQGIVLVDTPGADSVNARHTGVTFNYMKNADALIFVTYYNHAFSQGDRQFLNQLGRVKDSSAMDQMFFVVNASDLSSSEEELEQVLEHVSTQLRTNGIRAPRLFPVSSLLAMESKSTGDADMLEQSGFIRFEEEFNRFAGTELADLAVGGAAEELSRVIQRLDQRAHDAVQGEEVLQQRRQELHAVMDQSLVRIRTLAERSMREELAQETAELLFHVRQRLGYRLGLFMAEAFHPSVLREDRGNLKGAFAACGRELLRMIAVELEQELLATTLRLEQAGKSWLMRQIDDCVQELKERSGGMDLSLAFNENWSTPVLEEIRLEEPSGWKTYLSYFRNPKQFFEGEGRQRLQEALDPVIKQMVAGALPAAQEKLVQFYDAQLHQSLQHQASQLEDRLKEAVAALNETLTSGVPAEEWHSLSAQVQQFVHE